MKRPKEVPMEGSIAKIRLILALILAIFLSRSAGAVTLSNPPPENPNILDEIGFVSVLLSTANLPTQVDNNHRVAYTLRDGTKVGGLMFMDSTKGVRPLIIADFGLMSSATSTLAGDIIEKIVHTGMLQANFLVVDDISGADFYLANDSMSLGGYDAGRVLNGLADTLSDQGVPFSRLHLMGESLGGLAVLEALVEDHRLGTNHFHSAITFSGVTDEAQATATVMSSFGHPLSGISGPSLPTEGLAFLTSSAVSFDDWVDAAKSGFATSSLFGMGDFFYTQFNDRLKNLSYVTGGKDWNPMVDRSSVERYVETSAALVNAIAQVSAPVIVVHAQNDPVVAYSQFQSFAQSQQNNPRVMTLATSDGSHCGFLGVYGASWVANLINRSLNL